MFVLCDTSVLLMLLRIAPDMLTDERYNCVVPPAVREEFLQTQKFKNKYPWRSQYRSNVKTLPASHFESDEYKRTLKAVDLLVTSAENERTGRRFGLSRVDKLIAASVVAHEYQLSTGDADLRDFLRQEFGVSNVSALEILNDWLLRQLFEWNDERQGVLDDWERCREHAQPVEDAQNFKEITGREFPAFQCR